MDYVLSTDPHHELQYDEDTLAGSTDHALLHFSLPMTVQPPLRGATPRRDDAPRRYRWDVGTSTQGMVDGAARWKAHSDSAAFREGMERVMGAGGGGNEERSRAMEQYLLEEAEAAGVVTAVETRAPLNPNRWGKQLAPWFDADCRAKKKAFRAASFREGKGSRMA